MNVFADEITANQQACATDRFMYFNIDEKRAGRTVADYRIKQINDFDGGPVFYVEVGTHDAPLLAALGKSISGPWLAYDMLILSDDAERIGTITPNTAAVAEPMTAEHLVWPAVEEIAVGPLDAGDGDFTADEWAALGEEVGTAKRCLSTSGTALTPARPVEAEPGADEPLIRLSALSMRGNPMRPRRRTA